MKTKYKATDIATYLLSLEEMNAMKLNKLVGIAHADYLQIYKEPLLDEKIEAWKYGPIVVSVYRKYFRRGKEKLKQEENISLPKFIKQFLSIVHDNYKEYNHLQLSTLTHSKGTPWHVAWKKIMNNPFTTSLKIPNKLYK